MPAIQEGLSVRSPITDEMPREEAFMAIMRSLHLRWRIAIALPLVYLGVGAAIAHTIFSPANGKPGFAPLDESLFTSLCLLGGFLIGALWVLLVRALASQLESLGAARESPERFLAEARRHQLAQFALCDLAASIGIVLFLIQGDIAALLAFCLASEILYLRAFPSDLRLGEAMFRSTRA
jgi:hypothetical protein